MNKSYRDFIDELDLEAYQFLFELPDTDKLILAEFANLSTIDEWQNMIKQHLRKPLPAYGLLDCIHLQFVLDRYDYDPPFEQIDYDRLQSIFEKNEKDNNGIPNMLEVNTLGLLESLRNNPCYTPNPM